MAEIKPKIVDGVAFWNVDPKNKKAFNELFQGKITEIFNKETKAKGSPLTKKEISNLRSHPDLGVWVIDGKPASVTDLNQFLSKKKSTLSLHVPKRKNQYFTRKMLESPKNMPREVRRWFKRLDDKGWPTGRSKKGFVNYLNRAYDQTVEYNKILEKRLGFSFDAGHFWGAMGPEGDRTIIGPYGARSEGKFTFRNVTSQPRTPSMNQLLNPEWNVITPNVPGFFDKRSVQVTGAQELLDVGAGGQGWSGSLADYLTEGLNDIDKMDAWDKAYIAFGDPQKGASGTAESRLAELVEPGGKDKVLKRISDFTGTAEDLSGPVRTIKPGTEENWRLSSQGDLFAFDGSAGTMALDRPGLLSQSWRAAINNADSSLTNLTQNVFDAEKIFSLQGGYNKLGKGMARDFGFGLPFMYAFDKEFREDLHEGDYLSAGNRAVKDYVWGEAIGRGVINPLLKGAKYTYGLLPGAVRSTIGTTLGTGVNFAKKASPYAAVTSLGGSTYRPKPRWEETGFPSEEVYNSAIEELTAEKGEMHASFHTTSYDKYLKRKNKLNEEEDEI